MADECDHGSENRLSSQNGAMEICLDCGCWYFHDDGDDWRPPSGTDSVLLLDRVVVLGRAHTSALNEAAARLTAQEARDMFAKRDEAARREVNSVRIQSANTKSEMARLMKVLHAASPIGQPDRYECTDGRYDEGAVMEQDPRGDWVSWDDYLKLLASRGGAVGG